MLNKNQVSSDGLDIRIVKTLDDLESHATAWNDLAYQALHRLPDQSYAWVASYLEHALLPDESWFCFFAYNNEELKGVLPVIVTPQKRIGLSCYTFRTPYNDQTASIDFLVEPGFEETIIPLFLAQLNQTRPACFCFEMRRLPNCSRTLSIIKKGVKRIKAVEALDGYGSFVKIAGTFEDYQARLGTKYTRNLRRLDRKFFALPGAKISFLTGKSLSEQELTCFMNVEAASWKCTKGSALCQYDSLVSFYTALTKRLKELGWLEWHFLETEGKTVAANLAIRVNRSLLILKTCYDEAYAPFSPGTVLFGKMFERAFSGGEVDEVNLLTDYSWNQNWLVEKRAYYNLYLFPNRPFPNLAGYIPLKARKGARQLPGVRPLYNYCLKWFDGSS
ncbi:MAG: hypothetical protein C0407_09790 [Desulfobacca sp.]|nr:hypothetical protein [Desulfobacca sp.]